MSYIGRLPSIYFDMSRESFAMGFIIQQVVFWISLATLILIGLLKTLITSPLQDMFLVWDQATDMFLIWDQARSNLPLLYPQ